MDNLQSSRLRLLSAALACLAALTYEGVKLTKRGEASIGAAFAFGFLALLVIMSRFHRFAAVRAAVAIATAGFVYATFPLTPNHVYLASYGIALYTWATATEGRANATCILWLARFITANVLLMAGMQKLWYGTYDQGEFFAFHISIGTPRFTHAATWLAGHPTALLEIDGLTADGPFRLKDLWAQLASMMIPLVEIALVPLLWIQRTRFIAVVSAILFVTLIQVVAAEISFALLEVAMLSLFLPLSGTAITARYVVLAFLSVSVAVAGGIVDGRAFN